MMHVSSFIFKDGFTAKETVFQTAPIPPWLVFKHPTLVAEHYKENHTKINVTLNQ